MKKRRRAFTKSNFLVVTIILGCIGALGVTAFSPRKQIVSFEERQREKRERLMRAELRVQNLTRALTVVKTEKHVDQDALEVVFRNDYEKIITAYKVAVGSGTVATECLSEQEADDASLFRPGEMRRELYPLQVDIETLGIRVLAVVFEDKTSDGLPEYVHEIRDYRLGLKLGISRVLQLIEGISQLPEAELPRALGELRTQLAADSKREERAMGHFVKVGFRDVSARVSAKLAQSQSELQERKQSGWHSGRELTIRLVTRLTGALNKL